MTHDSTYAKPYQSIREQIRLLADRGMDVGDGDEAAMLLRRVGYYRLSGYWYPYRERETAASGDVRITSRLSAGTSLMQVSALYDFDRELRMLILDAIETIEVALRFTVGHALGRRSTFAHRDPTVLDPGFAAKRAQALENQPESAHAEWLERFDEQEERSQEAFAAHFRAKYGPHLPVWVATEVMTFGTLGLLYSGAAQNDREQIALAFELITPTGRGDGALLSNWFNHIRHVRNLCAHHSRLWNRAIDVPLANANHLPGLEHLDEKSLRRIYGTIAVLAYLLERVKPHSGWMERVRRHIETGAAALNLDIAAMGFPEDWDRSPLWSPAYSRNVVHASRIQLLSEFETLTTAEMRERLHSREPRDRRSWLNYLRQRHALVSILFGTARLFPDFQLDESTGDITPLVGDINSELYAAWSGLGLPSEDIDWKILTWWTETASERATPLKMLRAGELTIESARELYPSS